MQKLCHHNAECYSMQKQLKIKYTRLNKGAHKTNKIRLIEKNMMYVEWQNCMSFMLRIFTMLAILIMVKTKNNFNPATESTKNCLKTQLFQN